MLIVDSFIGVILIFFIVSTDGFSFFDRSWDHHDLLFVQPEYNGSSKCSTSARLISIAPYSDRKETAVYATDLQTGAMVRCKVLIDKISRIKIFHHAVKISLDELATLHITAFDDEGIWNYTDGISLDVYH